MTNPGEASKTADDKPVISIIGVLIGMLIGIILMIVLMVTSNQSRVYGVVVVSDDQIVQPVQLAMRSELGIYGEYRTIVIPKDISGEDVTVYYHGKVVDHKSASIPDYTLIWWSIKPSEVTP